jgi:hypothetical protein
MGDDDFDSVVNLAEYALGGIPVTGAGSNSTGLLPKPDVTGVAPTQKLTLLFSLPDPPPSDVKYTIQGHNNLTGTWTDLATKTGAGAWSGAATVTAGAPAGGYIPYTMEDIQVTTGVPRRFMRLKMELVP